MKVTLSDIADDTGFSISTVSRALRSKGKISKGNKRIILESAKRLDYPMQKDDQLLLSQENRFIALVAGFHTGEFYASFFDGFVQAGKAKNIDLSMFSASADTEEICLLLTRLAENGYSSAVLFIPALQPKDYRKILDCVPNYFPIISCTNMAQPVLDTVTFDAYRGASLVANHFISRGYQNVGFIEGPSHKPEARFRKNGFVDTIKHDSESRFLWSYPGDYTLKSGIRAFHEFKTLDEKPRAIFAANDATALGFMESARSHGYHFPDDIALAGYDNLPMCEYHFPNITSVNTDYQKLAEITLSNLTDQLFNPAAHQGLVNLVPVNLIVRHSS